MRGLAPATTAADAAAGGSSAPRISPRDIAAEQRGGALRTQHRGRRPASRGGDDAA